MFYIKSSDSYWTGHSWTSRIEIAKEYDFTEGIKIIEKRFHSGIRRAKRNGAFYWEPVPVLEQADARLQKEQI